MATLDVSDIPVCAEFADSFQVLSRAETIDETGRSNTAAVVATATGTIYPTGDNSLVRQDAYEHGQKTITIVTPYRLKQAAPGFQPDLVLWRGDQFVVKNVEDYSQYGAGFIVAEASSIDAQDLPPQ